MRTKIKVDPSKLGEALLGAEEDDLRRKYIEVRGCTTIDDSGRNLLALALTLAVERVWRALQGMKRVGKMRQGKQRVERIQRT